MQQTKPHLDLLSGIPDSSRSPPCLLVSPLSGLSQLLQQIVRPNLLAAAAAAAAAGPKQKKHNAFSYMIATA